MVGSADYWNTEIDGKFNVAVDGLRQPGSSFKPFTYVTFLAQGRNAAYMFLDVRQAFSQGAGMAPYVPENYSRTYHGPVSLRNALARSYNGGIWAGFSGGGGYDIRNTVRGWTRVWAALIGREPTDIFAGVVGGMMFGPEAEAGSLVDPPVIMDGERKRLAEEEAERVGAFVEKEVLPLIEGPRDR